MVHSMQINGFPNAAMLSAYRTGAKTANAAKKTSQTHGMSFDLMVRNGQLNKAEQMDKTASAAPLTPEEEMAAFKQEIYDELAEINKMNSSAVLSNSVHITEDGFKRMKEDPAYRKEIMDWMREDARLTNRCSIKEHITTTITGSGATSSCINVFDNDSIATKASKQQWADKKGEGAFYRSDRANRDYADRKAAQRKRDSEYVASERMKRELMQKMLLDKSIAQQEQHQALNQQAFQQQYLENYMLGMQPPNSWNISEVFSSQ